MRPAKIKYFLATILMTLNIGFAFAPAVHATDLKGDACQGLNTLNGSNSTQCSPKGEKSIGDLASSIVSLLSLIVGIAAVIMIIIAGLKYVTSGGDSNAVGSAKNTLIYAIVGLIVVAIAQFIVHFVVKNVHS